MATETFSSFGSHRLIFDFIVGKKTGSLCFQPGGRKLFFEEGQLIFANSEMTGEHFSDILVDMEVLDTETLSELKAALSPGESLGKKLKDLGLANASQLAEALKQQIILVVEKVLLIAAGNCEALEGSLPARVPKLRIQALALVLRTLSSAENTDFLDQLDNQQPVMTTPQFDELLAGMPIPSNYEPLLDRLREGFPASCNTLSDELSWGNQLIESLIYVLQLLRAVTIEPKVEEAAPVAVAGAFSSMDEDDHGLDQTVSAGLDYDNPLDLSIQDDLDTDEEEELDDFSTPELQADPLEDDEDSWGTEAGPPTDELARALDDTFDDDDEANMDDELPGEEPFVDPFEEQQVSADEAANDLFSSKTEDAFEEEELPLSDDVLFDDENEEALLSSEDVSFDDENEEALLPSEDVLFDDDNDDAATLLSSDEDDEADLFAAEIDEPEAFTGRDEMDISLEALDEAAKSPFDQLDANANPNSRLDAMDRAAMELEAEGFGYQEDEEDDAFKIDEEAPFSSTFDDDDDSSEADLAPLSEASISSASLPKAAFYSGEFDANDLKGGLEDVIDDEPSSALDKDTVPMTHFPFENYDPRTDREPSEEQSEEATDGEDNSYSGPGSYLEHPKSRFPMVLLAIVVITGGAFGIWTLMNGPKTGTLANVPVDTQPVNTQPVNQADPGTTTDPAEGVPTDTLAEETVTEDVITNTATSEEVQTPGSKVASAPKKATTPDAAPTNPATTKVAANDSAPKPNTVPPKTQAAKPQPSEPRAATVAASASGDVDDFVKDSLDRFKAAKKPYCVALVLACERETANAFLAKYSHEDLYILPGKFKGRDCLNICWGSFATRREAFKARTQLPEALSDIENPWVKDMGENL